MKHVKTTRFMAILLSATILMGCLCAGSMLSAAGATLANVTATELTVVPTASSLISGLTPVANNASDHSKYVAYGGTNIANITDGAYPGVNAFVMPVRDEEGNLVNNNDNHPEYGIKSTANDIVVQFSCWTNDYIDLTFALGSENKITSFAVGSSAEPSLLLKENVQDWTDDQIIDAYKNAAQAGIRLFKGEFYVADTAAALFDDSAKAATWDYTNEKAPLAAEYTLEQTAKGQYVGFRLYIGSGWASLFRIGELAVFGKSTAHTVTDISAGVNEDKLIAAEDNLLGKAISTKNNATWQAALPDTTYDGKVVSVHGADAAIHTLVAAGSNTFWATYDLGTEHAVESFLFSGGGSYLGCRGITVYVGDKTHEQLMADADALPVYSSPVTGGNDGKDDRIPGTKRIDFVESVVGRYVVVRLAGEPNGGSYQYWISELAATGRNVTPTVTDISAGVNEDKLIAKEDNLLGKAISTKNNATWQATLPDTTYDGKVVSVHGADAAIHTLVAAGSNTFWATYDLGTEYAVDTFLFSGGGSWVGCRGITVYVGDKTHEELMTDADALPVYSSPVTGGNDGKDDRIPGTKRIDFAESVVGRYVVVRLAGEPNGANYQYWISELAATGSPLKELHKIVCVGDSITWGAHAPAVGTFSYEQYENNYPVQLEKLLDNAQDDVDYMVVNAGIGGSAVIGATEGYPTSYGTAPIHWLTDQEQFGYVQEADTVLIMLGTNDASSENGCWDARSADYKTYYKKIIEAFRAKNADINVYIVTSPYAKANNHRENLANGVVPQQAQLAGELGLPLIDVYAATKQFVADNNPGVTDETQWDMSCFVDAVDLIQGPYLHPHEAGLTVIAETCFDALTAEDTSDQYVLYTAGAQVRGDKGETAALRFGTNIASTGITRDDKYNTVLTADSHIVVGGQICTVTGMGTVVGIEGAALPGDLVIGTNTGKVKDVPAEKLYEIGTDEVTFTAVVTNVPKEHFDTNLLARPYVKYTTPDGVELYAYGAVIARNVNGVPVAVA